METTVVYVMFICQDKVLICLYITSSLPSVGLEKKQQIVSIFFVFDQAAQVYHIYLIVYVCVGN